jgi:undecaprenyl diphosphate synthase
MDGNGRWARERNLPRHAGHKAGVKSVRSVVEESARKGIEVLTLFAFSSENWRRPEEEVNLLMELFLVALRRETRRLSDNNVQLRIIGDTSAFPDKLQRSIILAQQETAGNNGLVLQIAANYGGRWDITQATRRIAEQVEAGRLSPEDIDESTLEGELSFPDLPLPDLFIRTGGEQRLSNFLLWQAAYTELYFTSVLWPDFDASQFSRALESFSGRQRRFGRTGEQVTPVAPAK